MQIVGYENTESINAATNLSIYLGAQHSTIPLSATHLPPAEWTSTCNT